MVKKRKEDDVSAPAPDGKSGKKGKRKEDDINKAVKKQKTEPEEVVLVNDEPNKVKEVLPPKKEPEKKKKKRKRRQKSNDSKVEPGSICDKANGEPEKKKKRKSRQKSNDSKVEPGSICDKANGEPEKKKKKRKRQQKSNDSKVEPGSICDKDNGVRPKTRASTSATSPLPNSLFVANLSGRVNVEKLKEFFKDVGDIVDIQFDTFDDGSSRGFARVEFATAEAVEKACMLNGHTLMGQPVKLNYGCEQRIHNPGSRDNSSFKKPRHFSKNTVLIRGFDSNYELEQMRFFLEAHFAECKYADRSIKRVLLQKDNLTGASDGIAFMEFSHSDLVSLALQKNGSVLLGFTLTVEDLEHEDAEEL